MATAKEILQQARARFLLVETAESDQRKRELEDIRVYNGDQWPQDLLDARAGIPAGKGLPAVPARPSLVVNKVRQPVQQVRNEAQASDLGVELVPADDFAALSQPPSPEEIELREGFTRRIQRTTEAADARLWALGRALICGRGFYGITTKYVDVPSLTAAPAPWMMDQELTYERFGNQFSVMLDPAHIQPDGSDAEWAIVGADISWDQYKAEYGTRANGEANRVCHANDSEFRAFGDDAPSWFNVADDKDHTRTCRVVSYYYTERETKKLVQVEDGRFLWADEAKGLKVRQSRNVVVKTVKWCKLDGCDDGVLDETVWPSPYIPIFQVTGEELQPTGGERRYEGMVRPAIGAQRGFNYIISKLTEEIGLSKIPDVMMVAGQDEGFEREWDMAATRTLSRLHYNQVDDEGRPAPPPSTVPRQSNAQILATALQIYDQSIQSTTSTPDPTLGRIDPSIKSGKLAEELIKQSQKGTSHFLGNYQKTVSHDGRVLNSMLYPVYGTRPERIARIVSGTNEEQTIILGVPMVTSDTGMPQKFDPTQHHGQEPKTYTLTPDANFNVVVKAVKNFDTRREQQTTELAELIASDPAQMSVVGDLFFKYQDGPGHEELSERYKAVLDPRVLAIAAGKQPLPPEVQQQMAAMQQAGQEMQAELQQLKLEKAGRVVQGQMDMQRTQLEIDAKHLDVAAQESTKLDIAGMQRDIKIILDVLKIRAEAARTDIERQQETRLAHHDTAHDAALTHSTQDAKHAHERDMAETAHANALDVIAATPTPTVGAAE